MDLSFTKKAFDYKVWADQRILKLISNIDPNKHQDTEHFCYQQLNHMIIVEELFRSRIVGQPPRHQSTNTDTLPHYEELSNRLRKSNQWYLTYVDSLNSAELERAIRFTFTDGKAGCMSVGEILFHIVNHSTYHRSAIGHAAQFSSYTRPADTYSMYIHEMEPNRCEKQRSS